MSGKFNKKIIGLVLFVAGIMAVDGAVITVSTPVTKTTIQNAVDAASYGDIVAIPAGNWNISGTVNLKEGIHIRGDGIDSTVLNKTDATSTEIFKLKVINQTPFQISGINFKGIGLGLFINDQSSTILDTGISIYGKARFRIHDCRFESFTGNGIYVYGTSDSGGSYVEGHPEGVIDNNEFKDIYWLGSSSARGYGVGLYGDNSWPLLQLGTASALFVENNYFQHIRHCIADNMGGRYVFRYNVIEDNYYPFVAIDAHGKYISNHGSRSYEVYENMVTDGVEWPSQITHATWATGIRGGDGVIFNNIFWGMWRAMSISIEGWNSSMTYPVADQIRDLWVWGNTLDGSSYNTITLGYTPQEAINYALFLQEGRDYHEGTAKPGYEHYVYPHPLCSLVGYWKLDNDDSIQVDASYSGNNGSKHGSPLSITGYSGNALDFNGSSDYVEAPYSADFNTSEFTVSAWAKVEGGADTYRGLLSSRGSCHGYNIYAGSNNKWQFWTGTGTGYHALTGGDVVNSTWTHIVATYKNGTKTLYVNGVEYSGSSAMEVNSSQPFKIGTVDNYYYFNGAIDDVRYYSRAMSQTEIKAMYNRIPDPSFELNLGTVWSVRSGSPTSDPDEKYDGDQSLYFNKPYSNEPEVSVSMNNYVPVDGGKCYVLSAWAKGNNITLGTSGWHKLFVIGRWYDKNMVEISGVYPDIGINTGSFDWTKFEKSYTAPSNAVYYRATAAGIIGSGSGEGWLDLIEIRPAAE